RCFTVLGTAVLLLCGGTLHGQEPAKDNKKSPDSPPKQAAPPAPAKLEELLSQALKNNPDISVAEAKRREAEAELNRTRLVVLQKVAAFHANRHAAQATVQEAEARYDRIVKIQKKGLAASEEVKAAELTLIKYKADLARIEADLPLLLGKLPGAGGG